MRTIIHEIRNHLAVAMLGIESLLDGKMEPTDARLAGIYHALQQVEALIDHVPRDRKIEFETRAEPIDVCALIGSEIDAIEGFAVEHGVALRVHRFEYVSTDSRQFLGSAVRISEILTNLLTNAILYTRPGGTVEIDCHRDGASLQFSILDEGPGVNESEQAKIFEFGYRGSAGETVAGSGFGLALVKEFVEGHGGTVQVQNRSERGATFTVRLPVIGARSGAST